MANEEIDRIMAERVMGWEEVDLDGYTAWRNKAGHIAAGFYSWFPSTSRVQAIDCLEAWIRAHEVRVRSARLSYIPAGWCVSLRLYEPEQVVGYAQQESLALAICKALAEAIGTTDATPTE